MTSIRIVYPQQFQTVNGAFFVAFGAAKRIAGRVNGILRDQRGKGYCGTVLRPPPRWIVGFENVPTGTNYTLELWDEHGTLLEFVENINVVSLVAAGITIQSPADNATVCATFTSFGTADLNRGPITGTMTRPGFADSTGVTIQGPPSTGNWVVQFNGVPPGGGYKLSADNTSGDHAEKNNLTVVMDPPPPPGGGGG